MNDNILIRLARPDDAMILAQIHINAWREAYKGIISDSVLQKLDAGERAGRFYKVLSKSVDTEETYVAELHGRIAGFMTIGPDRVSDADINNNGEVWGIYIAPRVHRLGVGEKLMEFGKAKLFALGYTAIRLWVLEKNHEARKFYETMNFHPDGTEKIMEIGSDLLNAVRYEYRKQNQW